MALHENADLDLTAGVTNPEKIECYLSEFTRLNHELVTAHRHLTKSHRALEFAGQEKNRLLGTVAHDLRNPLGAVTAWCEMLEDELVGDISSELRGVVEEIREASCYMLALVNDLLDYSSIEAGKLRLDTDLLDLGDLIEKHLRSVKFVAEAKQIQIALEREADLPPVMGDARKLRQVIDNLVSNAVKFSSPGTTVVIRLGRHEGNRLAMEVTDHGPGLPADELDQIFRPFHRASVRGSAGESSTGLGLAIVHKIVAGHNGRISVESEVGKGTTFRVELPW